MLNDMLKRLSDAYKQGFIDGQNCGQQQAFDGTMIYLHRNGWGAQRIIRLNKGLGEVLDEYAPAFHEGMEQDIWQERMDREIADTLKGETTFYPFAERYPMFKSTGYDKRPKERRRK